MRIKKIFQIFSFFLLAVLVLFSYLPTPERDKLVIARATQVVDYQGLHLSNFYKVDAGKFVALGDVPFDFLQLILLAEDKRFYHHSGIDTNALGRAIWQNIKNTSILSGASTLTQQFVRLYYKYPRKFLYKPLVMLHSLKLEILLSKGQILEAYLNAIPFSHQQIGVASASEFYFNRPLNELSLSEKSSLVTLIRSPSLLSSKQGAKKLFKLKNLLLLKYFKFSDIQKWQQDIYLNDQVTFHKKNQRNTAFHYIQYLKKIVKKNGGKIVTTLDLNLQKKVQEILYQNITHLENKGVSNGAVLVVDNSNGDVLAYAGSYDFFDKKFGQLDAIQIPRQPGSTIKPFTYALALQSGYTLASVLPDIPLYFSSGNGSYRPRNYSLTYQGPTNMREALGNSLNIPALYLTDQLGVQNLLDFLKSFNLHFNQAPDYYGVGLTLGNAEINLWDLTQAYTAFSNRGKIRKLRLLNESQVASIATHMQEATAELINDVLSDNSARAISFGVNNIFNVPYHLAVKTGTSTLYRDNWAFGYNKKYTVGVWVGNMDQAPMHNVSGITGAGPILIEIFDQLMLKRKSRPFAFENKIVRTRICPQSGLLLNHGCPHSHEEVFTYQTIPTEKCNIHSKIAVTNCFKDNDKVMISVTSYSETYKEWAQKLGQYDFKDQIQKICTNTNFELSNQTKISIADSDISILSPLAGSIYGLDPNIPKKYQRLPFKLFGNSKIKKVQWFLNGKSVHAGGDSLFYWEVEKGSFYLRASIELMDGLKIEKQANFTVL